MEHPLSGFEVNGKGIKCFDNTGSGFFHFSPVSVIIGKNNSGKSSVVDLIDICIRRSSGNLVPDSQVRFEGTPAIEIKKPPSTQDLDQHFLSHNVGSFEHGVNDRTYATNFLSRPPIWRYVGSGAPKLVGGHGYNRDSRIFTGRIEPVLKSIHKWSLSELTLLRVAAERSVRPEKSGAPAPKPNGDGITNLIRYFINNDSQPRDVVEVDLLEDLNVLYAGDSEFTSIVCQENDQTGTWEIFLREQGKGDIRLSESGSSLQSVFIILSYLRLVPMLDHIEWDRIVLAIEEPENNLHPALLRRLISFLAERRSELSFSLVFTTHSPICIDWSTSRNDAGIIHVTRHGSNSRCTNVLDFNNRYNILDDLDVRGSDILQANGVIWVEGPSDRVYIKRWIDLVTKGELVEGSHYSFMYYGGKILSHFEAVAPTEVSNLISMVTLNRNIAIVMDSDRKRNSNSNRKPPTRLNKTKQRLRKEVADRGGFSWITAGKEIENYVPESVWKRIAGADFSVADEFVNLPSLSAIKAIKSTKVELSHIVCDNMELDDLDGHLDLLKNVQELVGHIRNWNSSN
ncbi:ATP-dependent nuclease [Ruegeria arenilitoris]|uniref:ATP-dependent nuclease n=1 Tax=Ruegeria arenilitoris TaxID=1173585 RepID=UPI00148095C2|nr:AAA family ATPase [Ruegeria arenilitoris]